MPARARLEALWQRLGVPRQIARCHPARGFPPGTLLCREDELGGYKTRKYLSLLPALQARGVTAVRLCGSSHSNNVLQLALRLKQAGIRPVYVLEGREGPLRGNGLFTRLLLGPDFVTSPTPELLELPAIPEGGCSRDSLAGALSMAASLQESFIEGGCPPQLWVDAGTGFSSAALVLGLGFLGLPVTVRVVWLGDAVGDFAGVVETWRGAAEEILGEPVQPACWELLRPPTARSFGAVNRQVLQEVARLAREEGLLVDPVYTAKLFLTARRHLQGPSLIFCGGGPLELCGFQAQLARLLAQDAGPTGS